MYGQIQLLLELFIIVVIPEATGHVEDVALPDTDILAQITISGQLSVAGVALISKAYIALNNKK